MCKNVCRCPRVRSCLCEVTLELDICLIGYVKECKYEIADRMLEQAHRGESCAVGRVERSGTWGVRVGLGVQAVSGGQ